MSALATVWKIKNNAEVHGLEFAATRYKVECKKQVKPDNFDVFYFALFGRWPARSSKGSK